MANNAGGNCAGKPVTSVLGFNFDSGTTCGLTEPTDLTNTDPQLGPLADNGGPTLTHALLDGSPAIDKGFNDTCEITDQRGKPGNVDGDLDGMATCDIGA